MLELPLVYQIGLVGALWILLIGIAKEPGIGWALFIFASFIPAYVLAVFIVNHPELFNSVTQTP